MRNRAKCKLCEDIIESMHQTDLQLCKCNEIGVDGGPGSYHCIASNWQNFIRIDDEGKEIIPEIVEGDKEVASEEVLTKEVKRERLVEMFKGLIDSYENLPSHAKLNSITHYDMQSALLIMYEIIRLG